MMEGLLLLLGGISVLILLFFYGAFAWGLVCWKFWYWFILPVFTTLPQVNLIECIGLMLFISLFRNQTMPVIKKEYLDETATHVLQIIAPLIVLLVGWLAKIFIVH